VKKMIVKYAHRNIGGSAVLIDEQNKTTGEPFANRTLDQITANIPKT